MECLDRYNNDNNNNNMDTTTDMINSDISIGLPLSDDFMYGRLSRGGNNFIARATAATATSSGGGGECRMCLLHVAIVALKLGVSGAVGVIRELILRRGAKTDALCFGIRIFDYDGYVLLYVKKETTPIQLFELLLHKKLNTIPHPLLLLLRGRHNNNISGGGGGGGIVDDNDNKRVRRLLSDTSFHLETTKENGQTHAQDILGNLLVSQRFSDVRFVCKDGIELGAHRAILASASPNYFGRAFDGDWEESTSGRWNTNKSSRVMKAILTFVYTGSLLLSSSSSSSLSDHSNNNNNNNKSNSSIEFVVELLSVSTEYQLYSLQTKLVNTCMHQMSIETVVPIVICAHAHNMEELIDEAFCFMRERSVLMLKDASFLALSQTHPILWNDFTDTINITIDATTTTTTTFPRKKRPRHEV